jgi:hypothetical protein
MLQVLLPATMMWIRIGKSPLQIGTEAAGNASFKSVLYMLVVSYFHIWTNSFVHYRSISLAITCIAQFGLGKEIPNITTTSKLSSNYMPGRITYITAM